MKTAWAVFARTPLPGSVKTRLAATLGETDTLNFYRLLLQWQGENLQLLKKSFSGRIHVFYTAPAGVSDRRAVKLLKQSLGGGFFDRIRFQRQAPGDLGEKLRTAFDLLLKNNDQAVIWGADIPVLEEVHFRAATAETPRNFIIPATDGGYALIALKKTGYRPEFFRDIRWGTAFAFADQSKAIRTHGGELLTSDPVPDLDVSTDILRCIRHLEKSGTPVAQHRLVSLREFLLKAAD